MSESTRPRRILILDDQSDVVDACATALRGLHHVVKTCSPFEALSFVDVGRGAIDLIISDFTMPGMNGVEFVQKIRSLDVQIPVILYTGKVLDDVKEGGLDNFLKILEKPFSGERLRKEVESAFQAIDRQRTSSRKYDGIAPHLATALLHLEIFLHKHGLEDLKHTEPGRALEVLGHGENYGIFLSWYYLRGLLDKIEA